MDKKLYHYKLNEVNPFLENTFLHIEKGDKVLFFGHGNEMMIDRETGEPLAHSVFAKKTKVDKAQFAKIYTSNIANMFGLSKTGIKIFGYVLKSIKPNSDMFIFSYKKCMEITGYKSKKSITDGLKELIDNEFIARGENQYMYFINPTVFFNGDRISFIQQYELKKEKNPNKQLE